MEAAGRGEIVERPIASSSRVRARPGAWMMSPGLVVWTYRPTAESGEPEHPRRPMPGPGRNDLALDPRKRPRALEGIIPTLTALNAIAVTRVARRRNPRRGGLAQGSARVTHFAWLRRDDIGVASAIRLDRQRTVRRTEEVSEMPAPTSGATQDSSRKRNEDDLRAPWGLVRTVLAAIFYAARFLMEMHR